jgi:hypothetical protein
MLIVASAINEISELLHAINIPAASRITAPVAPVLTSALKRGIEIQFSESFLWLLLAMPTYTHICFAAFA